MLLYFSSNRRFQISGNLCSLVFRKRLMKCPPRIHEMSVRSITLLDLTEICTFQNFHGLLETFDMYLSKRAACEKGVAREYLSISISRVDHPPQSRAIYVSIEYRRNNLHAQVVIRSNRWDAGKLFVYVPSNVSEYYVTVPAWCPGDRRAMFSPFPRKVP